MSTLYDQDGITVESPDSDGDYGVSTRFHENYVHEDEIADVARALASVAGTNAANGDAVVLASSVPFNEGLMRLAAAHDRTVTFSYAKGDGSVIEQRRLKPESVQTVGDHVTFIGYDPDRDDVRAYRVDRIKGEVSVA